MGACTFTVSKQGVVVDGRRSVEGTLTLSASYATSGDTIPMTGHGLALVSEVQVCCGNTAFTTAPVTPGGYDLRLGGTAAAPKVLAYKTTGVEETAATNLSTKAFVVRLIGTA